MNPLRGGWEAVMQAAKPKPALTVGDWLMVAFISAVCIGPFLWGLLS